MKLLATKVSGGHLVPVIVRAGGHRLACRQAAALRSGSSVGAAWSAAVGRRGASSRWGGVYSSNVTRTSLARFRGGGYARLSSSTGIDRKSTRLNSSHPSISYAVFCLLPPPRTSTLVPYTTLFRSALPVGRQRPSAAGHRLVLPGVPPSADGERAVDGAGCIPRTSPGPRWPVLGAGVTPG